MNNITLRSLCIVRKNKIEILSGNEVCKEEVGSKAFGLSTIPVAWTLPFFVISTEMYEMYNSGYDIEVIQETWCDNIIEAMRSMKFDFNQSIYIRSNMCGEGLEERGQFDSYDCSVKKIFETIKIYFDSLKTLDLADTCVPLLIQQFSQIIGKGHISNERRLSRDLRDWKGEKENRNWNGTIGTYGNTFTIALRNWRRKVNVNGMLASPLLCSSLRNIAQALEFPCAWATDQLLRIHFEWIFDGKYVYIVQADQEQEYGTNPMIQADSSYHSRCDTFSPKVLHRLSSEDRDKYSQYSKVYNSLIYNKLGLKTAPIYILEDQNEIEKLADQRISQNLRSDICAIVANPLVIRIDIATQNMAMKQMLPRTDDVRNIGDAIGWLKNSSKTMHDKYNGKIPFIFILHNFIPAFSSAFAYAEPNKRNVLLESLWGLPEGLYYYAHDKHVLDTLHQDFKKVNQCEISVIKKNINAKNNFIFPDANGKWKCDLVFTDYIWKQAIPKETWIKEIAFNTRKISEYIGTGVSVMWFIGVDPKIYSCNVLPWHHEKFTYDSVPMQANRKKHKNESNYIISRNIDIQRLKRVTQTGNRENIKYLFFRPIEENMIRNKDIIEDVGKLANDLSAVIILEGGVLSHAYYQLKRTGAAIEVSNVLKNTLLNVEHKKLVRDKVPDKIINGGEIAIIKKLSNNELFEQLRLKLIEESFEVLEADNQDELIQEIADVLEVIDSIIDKQKIDIKSVNIAKNKKKERAGGFDDGIILNQTALPVYSSRNEIDKEIPHKKKLISSWADKKEMIDYNKVFRRLRIPVSLKQWDTQFTVSGMNKRPDIHVELKAERLNATLIVEISIREDFEQLTLFDDE